MNKRVLSIILAALLLMVSLSGCGAKSVNLDENKSVGGESEDSGEKVKIGFVVGVGGLGDQSFCDMEYEGLKKAEEDFGIQLDYVEPQSVSEYETLISQFAQDGSYDLIIIGESAASTATEKVAEQFPDQKFSIVDAEIDAPNVKSLLKDFPEMTFLSGVLAGMMTTDTSIDKINEDNIIGIITGMDIPNMRGAVTGFMAGAKYVNPEVEVLVATVGSFGDPGKGTELAKSMYGRGADIVMQCAGASGLGVINEAVESNVYALGTASNQNNIEPKHIPASAVERLTDRMYNEVKHIVEGSWVAGPEVGGLKEDIVAIDYDESEVEVPQYILDEVENIRKKIVDGELDVPKTVEEIDEWLNEVK